MTDSKTIDKSLNQLNLEPTLQNKSRNQMYENAKASNTLEATINPPNKISLTHVKLPNFLANSRRYLHVYIKSFRLQDSNSRKRKNSNNTVSRSLVKILDTETKASMIDNLIRENLTVSIKNNKYFKRQNPLLKLKNSMHM